MPLFKRKKDKKIKPPMFPKLSEHDFPVYEPISKTPTTATIKQAIQGPEVLPEEKASYPLEEKAIFVQIEKYKQALDTLEIIKEKLKTSETILKELNELKRQEESELAEWQTSINEIKEKLSLIDNNLFEI